MIFMRIQISKTSFLTINWDCQGSIVNALGLQQMTEISLLKAWTEDVDVFLLSLIF